MITSSRSYELIQKIPLGMGTADIESIAWDSTNNRWLSASWYFATVYPFNQGIINNTFYDLDNQSMYLIPGPFGPQLNIWRDIYSDIPLSNGNLKLNYSNWRPAGMEIVNNILYVVDFYFGRVTSWDLTSDTLTSDSTLITNIAGVGANLDGLCHDPDNPEMLYITDFGQTVLPDGTWINTGYEAIYRLNTNDWSWIRIYNTSTPIIGIPSTITNYTITANGCIVNGGKLYAVDYKADHDADKAWIIYDILSEEWSVDFDILPNGGDGLVYISEIDTFYASDVDNGTLLKYKSSIDSKFEIIYSGMTSPADMDYNPTDRTIAIAEVYTGFVNFIQIDQSLFTTTTYYYTTMDQDSIDQGNIIIAIVSICVSLGIVSVV